MKTIKLLTVLLIMASCSSDDESCAEKKAEMNAKYDKQIEWVKENSNPIDYRKIRLLNEERQDRVSKLCN